MEKTFHITTFGCQMNEHDSEIMAGMLSDIGYTEKENRDDAKVLIINTCSVRENADKRFFGTLGQLKRRKEREPDLIVCVSGCMMQQKQITDTINEKYPWVDIIFGTNNIHRLPHLIHDLIASRQEGGEEKKEREVWDEAGAIVEGLPAKRLYRSKALVNIMYGCNNFCTYCIVPYTRGRERSRDPEEILKEVCRLAQDGVKEIMFLGQNVNSYAGENCSFAELIKRAAAVDGIERIRFMTSHPKDISDELIDTFRTCDKLCNNIHLPVQAGSDRILKRMNRKYTRAQYLERIRKLREAAPGITISTDIIVGFPGESEEDFQQGLDFVEKMNFARMHVFPYSRRTGTPAAARRDQVEEAVKKERVHRMQALADRKAEEFHKSFIGREMRVLFETEKDGITDGLTDNYIRVYTDDTVDCGEIYTVKIDKLWRDGVWAHCVR